MARSGLDKFDVKKASDALVAQGRYPSVDAVRAALGNTGSKTTIHKYLKELEKDAGKVGDHQSKTAKTLQDFAEQVAATLHAEADVRIEAVRAEHAESLLRNAADMAAMQTQIEALRAQLQQVETYSRNVEWAYERQLEAAQQKASPKPSGLGIFGALINNDRSGRQGWSRFNVLFEGRSGNDLEGRMHPAAYETLLPN
jgi:4-alpha-glucanotransferase